MLAKEIVNQETQLYSQSQQRKGALKEFISSDASFFIDPWMILCGALAISAMLLPGISGSYLLYILGSYAAVIGALADFTLSLKQGSFDATAFLILFNLSIGVVLGAVIFSRFISWLFSSYRQRTIALLVGFMIGAMKTVWPFWLYEYRVMPLKAMEGAKLHLLEPMIPNILGTQQFFALLVMIAAFLSVMTLELFANQKKIPLTISS
jgi:putative membrane protein